MARGGRGNIVPGRPEKGPALWEFVRGNRERARSQGRAPGFAMPRDAAHETAEGNGYTRGKSPGPLVGRSVRPIKNKSTPRAASRPSEMAQTMRDAPILASPAANTPGRLVM